MVLEQAPRWLSCSLFLIVQYANRSPIIRSWLPGCVFKGCFFNIKASVLLLLSYRFCFSRLLLLANFLPQWLSTMSQSQNDASNRHTMPYDTITNFSTTHSQSHVSIPSHTPTNHHHHPGFPRPPFHPQPHFQLNVHPPSHQQTHAYSQPKSRFPSPPPMDYLMPPHGSTPVPCFGQQSARSAHSREDIPSMATSRPPLPSSPVAPAPRRPVPLSDLNQMTQCRCEEESHKRKPTLHPLVPGSNFNRESGSGYGSQSMHAGGAQALRPETMKPRKDMLFGDHPATSNSKRSGRD